MTLFEGGHWSVSAPIERGPMTRHLLEALHAIDDPDIDEYDLDELRDTYVPAALGNLIELYAVSPSTYHDVLADETSPAVLRLVLIEAIHTITQALPTRSPHRNDQPRLENHPH